MFKVHRSCLGAAPRLARHIRLVSAGSVGKGLFCSTTSFRAASAPTGLTSCRGSNILQSTAATEIDKSPWAARSEVIRAVSRISR
jgi:hypothetical protein